MAHLKMTASIVDISLKLAVDRRQNLDVQTILGTSPLPVIAITLFLK
jgi:hypothetical protein